MTTRTEKDIRDRRISDRQAQRRAGSFAPGHPAALAALPDLTSRLIEREDEIAELRQSLLAEKSVRDERIRRSLAEASRSAELGESSELED